MNEWYEFVVTLTGITSFSARFFTVFRIDFSSFSRTPFKYLVPFISRSSLCWSVMWIRPEDEEAEKVEAMNTRDIKTIIECNHLTWQMLVKNLGSMYERTIYCLQFSHLLHEVCLIGYTSHGKRQHFTRWRRREMPPHIVYVKTVQGKASVSLCDPLTSSDSLSSFSSLRTYPTYPTYRT